MAEPDAYDAGLAGLLAEHRGRQIKLMAAFCKYWAVPPSEYMALAVEVLEGMTRFANEDIARRTREQQRAARRRTRR